MSSKKVTTHKLVVIIPCLNEEGSIGSTVKEVLTNAPNATVIVIDNNSTDSTAREATTAGAKVVFEPAPGKGRAFRRALQYLPPKFDALLMVDGDGTYEISPIHTALHKITNEGIDLVVGKRISHAGATETYRKGHRFGNKMFTGLNRLFHASEIEDSLSGWRLMSHKFVGTFPANSRGFEIETEMNAHVRNFDMNVSNLDVAYRERGNESFSKLRTYKDGLRILLSNFRIALQNRPLIFLGVPSLFSMLISIPLVARALRGYLDTGFVPQLPSLIVGTSMFIGGSTLLLIGYLLEQMRITYISTTRQSYLLSLNAPNGFKDR
jgi:glycosyltransferase involved in cell wall biosynthesis